MNNKALRGVAFGKVVLALLVLMGILVAEVVGVLFVFALDIGEESLWSSILPELAGAFAAVLGVMLLGGSSQVGVTRKDVAYTFRFGWWCIAVGLALMVFELLDYFYDGSVVSADWLPRLIECAILCLGIGVLEEFMFRGIIFNAMLAVMGGTHRGVVGAVMLTSLFFGLAHIDLTIDLSETLSAIQAVLKIIQTGMYSVMLCVILLRTRKLGGISLFHAFDDFVIIVPGIALFSEKLDPEYVLTGEDALPTVYFYLFVIALYLPFLIKSLRELHREQDVYRGAFMERAIAQQQARIEVAAREQELMPGQPVPSYGPQPPAGAAHMAQSGRYGAAAPLPPYVPASSSAPIAQVDALRMPSQGVPQNPVVAQPRVSMTASGAPVAPASPAPETRQAPQISMRPAMQARHLAPDGRYAPRRQGQRPPAPEGW